MDNVGIKDMEKAIAEIREILIKCAKVNKTMTYKELTGSLKTVKLAPNDSELFQLLDTLSKREDRDGHGLISALVIHQGDDNLPGYGFFKMAIELGRQFDDNEKFWKEEKDRVCNYWKTAR